MIRSVFAGFQSVLSLKARDKNVEVLRLFVRYIDITQHLLVYRHVSITLLYTQKNRASVLCA